MIKRPKLSTFAVVAIATLAIMATIGIMGGTIGQQQVALAQEQDLVDVDGIVAHALSLVPDQPNCPPTTYPIYLGHYPWWRCQGIPFPDIPGGIG